MKKQAVAWIMVCLSLCIGLLIYGNLRSEGLFLTRWFRELTAGKTSHFTMAGFDFPDWFVYSLPDGLWMFAFMLVILAIWNFRIHSKSMPWLIMALLSGIVFEFLQLVQIIPGWFDIRDLMLICLGASLPVFTTMIKLKLCKTN